VIRVLIVEDEPVVSRGHRAIIDDLEGFAVVAAIGTGRGALETVAKESVDLLLLDLGLPDIGGLEVCRAIRTTGRHVDVIAISAARDVDTIRGAVDLGIVEYVVKPFPSRVLRDKLLRHRDVVEERNRRSGALTQQEVDRLVLRGTESEARTSLPKGLSPQTLEAVVAALRAAGMFGRTAAGIADDVGLSARSARRYLTHLEETRCTRVTPEYGGPGRPELRYRWLDDDLR
jgi:response regulator of citrate/malate metabolism